MPDLADGQHYESPSRLWCVSGAAQPLASEFSPPGPFLSQALIAPWCPFCWMPNRHLKHNTSISHLLILLYKSAQHSQALLSLINSIAILQVTHASGLGIIFVFILQRTNYPSLKCPVYFPDSVTSLLQQPYPGLLTPHRQRQWF